MAVLSIATLGMFAYGAYSIAWVVVDLIHGARLELWAEAAIAVFGLLLALSGALVRVGVPGGLSFAIAGLLGLQSLAVHTAAHLGSGIAPQIVRAAFGLVLLAMAGLGSPR